jgi:hypothetical protein
MAAVVRDLTPMQHGAMVHLQVLRAQLQSLFQPQAPQQDPRGLFAGILMGRLGKGVPEIEATFKISALKQKVLSQSIKNFV